MKCFNLDQEALLQQEPLFKLMFLPGEQVPSYFTHRTSNGSSLAIQTALSQPFFRFRACAMVDAVSISTPDITHVAIKVNCRFRGDILREQFDSYSHHVEDENDHRFVIYQKANHVVIFDCRFALSNKDNASLLASDVDIEFHLTSDDSLCKIKGCGIRVIENFPSPDLLEADEVNVGGHEMEEYGDSDVETIRSRKRMRVT
uniref:Protein VARIATION IN COMPOUND TRIGGERED ROOT growth response n=2 Tax=Noccaea caerulescens TaxID=107243 RepID=A0A1J3EAG9_NOCCA